MSSRWPAGIAGAAGLYVMWSELTFKGQSTLTPILMVIGVGLVAIAAAHFLEHKN